MSWNSFKDIANKTLHQKGITPQIQESLVLEYANQILVDILGDRAHNKIKAVYWRDNALAIAVLDDNILNEFQNAKQVFIDELNKQFKKTIVKDINILS